MLLISFSCLRPSSAFCGGKERAMSNLMLPLTGMSGGGGFGGMESMGNMGGFGGRDMAPGGRMGGK